MSLLEKHLVVKRSTLPKAGKGLFTKKEISKGSRIVEYKGKIRTWKEVSASTIDNRYLFYINSKRVIDAHKNLKSLARFANDAEGIKTKGIKNNAAFINDNGRIFIEATNNIPMNSEVFVGYGKEYWQTIKTNNLK